MSDIICPSSLEDETLSTHWSESRRPLSSTRKKNAVLGKDIPQLQEIVGKQWKKEDELKGLKSELAALDRKIQLELAKENQPKQGELQEQVVNSDVATDVTCRQDSQRKGLRP